MQTLKPSRNGNAAIYRNSTELFRQVCTFFYRAALTLLVFQVYTFQIRNEPVYPQDKVENLNNFLDVLLEHQTNFQKAINSTGCLEEVSQTFMNHVRIGKKVKNNFWSDNKLFSRSCSIVTSRFWI